MLTVLLFAATLSVEEFERMPWDRAIQVLESGVEELTNQSEENKQRVLAHMLELLDIHEEKSARSFLLMANKILLLFPEHRKEVLIKTFKALNYLYSDFYWQIRDMQEFITQQPLSDEEWIDLIPYFPDVNNILDFRGLEAFFDEIRRKKERMGD